MILQAYDFINYTKKKLFLQIGGSDQWGNIVNGTDLIRRILQKDALWINQSIDYVVLRSKNG